MSCQPQMDPAALAAIQAQMQAKPQRKPDNEFSVTNFISFLEERLKTENEIKVQNGLNIENIEKILPALKALA